MNSKIFDDLMKFAKSSHENFMSNGTDCTSKEIPTAALVTGQYVAFVTGQNTAAFVSGQYTAAFVSVCYTPYIIVPM